MIVLLYRNIFLLLLIHTLKNYVQTPFLQLSHWQIFLSALDKCCNTSSTFIHSLSFWPAHFSHWKVKLQLYFLPCIILSCSCLSGSPTIWPILSPSLPGADSCLHTAGYTSHCFSSQHHTAFPGTALRHGRSVQGRGSSHLLCKNAWWNIQGGSVLGTLVSIVSSVLSPPETADFQERHSAWHRNTLQNDLCMVLVQWLLAGGSPQPPGTHDIGITVLTKNPEQG